MSKQERTIMELESKSRVLEELNDEHDQLLLDWLINQKTEGSEEGDKNKGRNAMTGKTKSAIKKALQTKQSRRYKRKSEGGTQTHPVRGTDSKRSDGMHTTRFEAINQT